MDFGSATKASLCTASLLLVLLQAALVPEKWEPWKRLSLSGDMFNHVTNMLGPWKPLPPSEIVFSHATNSKVLLDAALNSSIVNFLEVDVLVSKDGLQKKPEDLTAEDVILSHPPKRTSDLTVAVFLEKVAAHNEDFVFGSNAKFDENGFVKSVKLDFKDPEAVDFSLQQCALQQSRASSKDVLGELWLNADVFQGPGGRLPRFKPNDFVETCLRSFPTGILSIGWSTGWWSWMFSGYTTEMVQEMLQLCEMHGLQGKQVTFPLDCSHAMQRPEAVQELLTPGHTVTIWGERTPDCEAWTQALRLEFPDRVYVDVTKSKRIWPMLVGALIMFAVFHYFYSNLHRRVESFTRICTSKKRRFSYEKWLEI